MRRDEVEVRGPRRPGRILSLVCLLLSPACIGGTNLSARDGDQDDADAETDVDADSDDDADAESGESPLCLTLTSEATIPDEIDEVRLSVVASRTSEPLLCGPVVRTFPLAVPGDLPMVFEYRPGTWYNFWIAFRAEWFHEGTRIALREVMMLLSAGGLADAELGLTRACYDVGTTGTPCGDAEQCVDGLCVGMPPPDPFDSPELIESAICDFVATGP